MRTRDTGAWTIEVILRKSKALNFIRPSRAHLFDVNLTVHVARRHGAPKRVWGTPEKSQ